MAADFPFAVFMHKAPNIFPGFTSGTSRVSLLKNSSAFVIAVPPLLFRLLCPVAARPSKHRTALNDDRYACKNAAPIARRLFCRKKHGAGNVPLCPAPLFLPGGQGILPFPFQNHNCPKL